ncbi:M23 family metallopeptidase [uncultured Phenylobacterium sp.]|uniref:M23 family metallopeptidase n=1 Tax=uncultured Phenylobacterium sp. TaxID=349273 RepID=UPI0025ED9621|nr:M23 family metallopeptidase [uncultured Phenylobacterium sp.]
MRLAALALAAGLAAPAASTAPASQPPAGAPAPALAFPLACQPGRTCEIQHYVDRDPGPGTQDYRCGLQTYNAHSGIDIRLPSMVALRRGVAVLAAAPGKVARLRDGVADISIRAEGAPSVANAECGNGVVVDHGGGWETQYCHMARGSIVVKVGQPVVAGTALGRVGLSGNTEFPHLHLSVRHNGQVVDPFAPAPTPPGSCRPQTSLWTPQAQAQMAYHAGAILNAGFTEAQFQQEDLEEGRIRPFTAASPWLIAYGRAIALLPGDEIELVLRGPDGKVLTQSRRPPLARWRAQEFTYIGKRRPPTGWSSGRYTAEYRVWRKGAVALSRHLEIAL